MYNVIQVYRSSVTRNSLHLSYFDEQSFIIFKVNQYAII